MKGQFFILGALVIVLLFYAGLSVTSNLPTVPETELNFFYYNLNSEYPRALNHGLGAGDVSGTMQDFTAFVDGIMTSYYLNFTALWVVMEGDGTTTVTVTAGNYLKNSTTLTVDLESAPEVFSLSHNETGSAPVTGVPSTISATIAFGSFNRTVTLSRDKVNAYIFFRLARGQDHVQNEIIA